MFDRTAFYDEEDPDAFDETGEELAYRLPSSYFPTDSGLDDPLMR
jgi:hypothetical protein